MRATSYLDKGWIGLNRDGDVRGPSFAYTNSFYMKLFRIEQLLILFHFRSKERKMCG